MNFMYDPMFWLSGLGTLAGAYGAYQQNRQYQGAYRDQQRAAQEYQRMLQQYYLDHAGFRERQLGMIGQFMSGLMGMMNSPINPDEFYKPLSDKAAEAVMRSAKLNLGARGIQPSPYWDAVTAETLANTETNRYSQAIDAAVRARQGNLSAFASGFPAAFGGMTAPVAPSVPWMPNLPNQPASPYSALSGIGNYFQYSQNRDAQARAQAEQKKQWEQLMRVLGGFGGGGGTVQSTTPRSSGSDFDPSYYQGGPASDWWS